MNCQIKNWEGKEVGNVDLADDIFSLERRDDLLVKVINYQRAKAQAGTHSSKTISQVSGTTKKPHRQKGTGNARQGSKRAPHMPGGGIIFGPVVRSHAHRLNKKVKRRALMIALSVRAKEGNLVLLESFVFDKTSTKDAKMKLKGLSLGNALFVDGNEVSNNFKKSISNIDKVDILPACGLNVLSILKREKLVLSKEGLDAVISRLSA